MMNKALVLLTLGGRREIVETIECSMYNKVLDTHSGSSGSTDSGRKGRTSDSSQHFKVVCCRRRGKRPSTQNKKLYPTGSGPRANLMTSTHHFFFLWMDWKNFPTCNDIVRSSKRQSSLVEPDRPATRHSGMGQASVAIMVQGKRP
jgi:hypothetical protein